MIEKQKTDEPAVAIALAMELRSSGRTCVQIAQVLRARFDINAFESLRLAHCWSRADAATEWNKRWPDEPKHAQNLTFWESWPDDGYTPSLPALEKLAELYECGVSDLVVGIGDFRYLDEATMAWQQTP